MPAAPARRPATTAKERDLSRPLPAGLSWTTLALFTPALVLAWTLVPLPWWVPAAYGAMSVIAFAAYGLDKLAARKGWNRVSESTLLALGLLCGWPGALIAQQLFRHKTRKRAFRRPFWGTVVLNVVALGAFATIVAAGILPLT
ncbi:DUF1294 domain-containing protein [Microbacter sp. GSS18]|nr:DUF1294 domain-containing protein [Microbacter sp. GSS18]